MAKNTLSVHIPEIQNQELEIDIVGRTPLLVKRFDEKTQQGIEDAQQGMAKRKKEPRNPKEECERARIKDAQGRDCVRAIWFKKGMAAMGGYFGIPRGNVEQGVYVAGDLIPVKSDKPVMRTDRVRVGMGGMAKTSVAYRPEFSNWSCRIRIGFDASVLTPHQVLSLLAHAGGKNGIGEWRPQKGGDFGRFDVFPAGTSKKLIEASKKEAAKAAPDAAEAPKKRGRKPAAQVVEEMIEEALPTKRGPGRPRKEAAVPAVANKVVRRASKKKVDDGFDLDTLLDGLSPAEKKRAIEAARKKLGL